MSPEARSAIGGTAFVLGNGPSLRDVELSELSRVATIGMNAAYRAWERIDWYPTHYCCLDEELIATHHEAIRSLIDEGRVETAFLTARMLDFHPDLARHERCFYLDSFRAGGRWKERRKKYDLPYSEEEAFQSSAPSKLTTGAYAVRYAIFLGYHRLYLLGIDCNYVELLPAARKVGDIALEMSATPDSNPNYFFDDYQQAGDRYNIPNPEVHGGNLHLQALEAVRDDVAERRLPVEIRNCARKSKLNSAGVFPFEDVDRALGRPRLGGVAVPMTHGEEEALIAQMRLWATPQARPRFPTSGYPVPLIAVLNGRRDEALEARLLAAFDQAKLCPDAFSELRFMYCELSEEEDKYERDYSKKAGRGGFKSGPNAQFFRSMELLRGVGRYVFMMETDCFAIRPDWLGELERIVEGSEPFWIMGSLYRGVDRINQRYRTHINGNAVYAVGDDGFQDFVRDVWRPRLEVQVQKVRTLAYDCLLPLYFTGENTAPTGKKWTQFQQLAHRFRYTEFIQNHASIGDGVLDEEFLSAVRDAAPHTYVVHGRNVRLSASGESEAPGFEAVAVHQMGKVGSRSLVNAIEGIGRWPCFHTHVLSPTHNPSLRPEATPTVPARHEEIPRHIFDARELRAEFIDTGRPIAVITPIREPIGRNVSAFFQNLDGFTAGQDVDPQDAEQLYELFRREYPHNLPQRWLEQELNEPFSVDVFAEPFPETGYVELTSGPHRILLLKASLEDVDKARAMSAFLGTDPLNISRVNVTKAKAKRGGRLSVLERFRALVGGDGDYLDEMLGLPMARHFFSAAELEAVRREWREAAGEDPSPSRPAPKAEPARAEPKAGFEAVTVHTMGKVGAAGVTVGVRRLENRLETWPSFHTHMLNPSVNPSLDPAQPAGAEGQALPDHVRDARKLREEFIDRGRPIAVITPIREPIARNVAVFFAQLDGMLTGPGKGVDPHDADQLYELFRREHSHHVPQRWLEQELNQPFGIDVFAEPFPETGVLELAADPHKILLLRSSIPDRRKAAALRHFLGAGVSIPPEDPGAEKLVADRGLPVREFQRRLGRDRDYIDEMLDLPMARHFFTEQQREAIRSRWLGIRRRGRQVDFSESERDATRVVHA